MQAEKTTEEILSELDVSLAQNVKADRDAHITIQRIIDQFKLKYGASEEGEE